MIFIRYRKPTVKAKTIRRVGRKDTPPSLGTGIVWTRRDASGKSKIRFLYDTYNNILISTAPITIAMIKSTARIK